MEKIVEKNRKKIKKKKNKTLKAITEEKCHIDVAILIQGHFDTDPPIK